MTYKDGIRNPVEMISFLNVVGILNFHGTPGEWTTRAQTGEQQMQDRFQACGVSIDLSISTLEWTLSGCQTVPIW